MSISQRSRAQVEAVRQAVYERDSYECIVAGSLWARLHPCVGVLTIQHAIGKGMGSSALFDSPEWLRTMCSGHNQLAEQNAAFAKACTRHGWSVPRHWRITSDMVAVRYPGGADYILMADCTRVRLLPDEADEMRLVLYGPRDETKRILGDGRVF